MFFNCSPSNTSLPAPSFSHTQYLLCFNQCYHSSSSYYILITFTIISVTFFLPVYVLILHLGFNQWRQRGFSAAAMSHFDFFTYNMVLFELLGVFAGISSCYGIETRNGHFVVLGSVLTIMSQSGQLSIHILTCAERHLAAVHPITYRNLKGQRWIRARSAIMICVWLLSILMAVNVFLLKDSDTFLGISIPVGLTQSLVLVFCLSVLRALMRSGPGEGNGGRQQVDQSKMRAFRVIVGVMVVLMLRLSWNVISGPLLPHLNQSATCYLLALGLCTGLPSSLLMPLLYLQRKGKLLCCNKKKGLSNSKG